jgi:hypothetical protein
MKSRLVAFPLITQSFDLYGFYERVIRPGTHTGAG